MGEDEGRLVEGELPRAIKIVRRVRYVSYMRCRLGLLIGLGLLAETFGWHPSPAGTSCTYARSLYIQPSHQHLTRACLLACLSVPPRTAIDPPGRFFQF